MNGSVDMNAEVLVRRDGTAGILSLNRPKAIHALTLGMCHAMAAALLAWRDDPTVSVVMIDHAEGRGFCSGGDINLLRESALHDGGVAGQRFFHDEYQLNVWATNELTVLRAKSPQACKVALRQLAAAAVLPNFAANMAMEYRIASRVLLRPDFVEGVRALIVDKDNAPRWDPATPQGVSEDLLEAIFAPLPQNEEWKPL